MELYSTRGESPNVNLKEAVFKGLPSDNGLFMPTEIPQLDPDFVANIEKYDFQAIAYEITRTLIGDEISNEDIKTIIEESMNFDVPLVKVTDNKYCLELFHGPSLAFKDFGARFMARLMSHFLKGEDKDINILVATSGDTGSAVAQGFLGVKGIKVTILYPSGKVSDNQEKQLTTLGQNITALEVDGVFDDCQRLVKSAFLDEELTSKMNLSSANSINIARLIPQSFYYAYAYAQLKAQGIKDVVFSVPSGNFGNICGGMIVRNMGLPIKHFIASTNINDIVPEYIRTGNFEPKNSIATISNAMDVGAPSNFPRFLALNGKSHDEVVENVTGKKYDDDVTRYAMKKVFEQTNYVMCPHTAVAFLGLVDYVKENNYTGAGVFLASAHPAKFDEVVSACIDKEVVLPEALAEIAKKEKVAIPMTKEFGDFKNWLLKNRA